MAKHLVVGAGLAQHLERREARHRGDRVARQRADLRQEAFLADRRLVEQRHDVGTAADGRQREAAADDLAHGADVGRHAVEFLRAAIGEAEAGDDLVEDQRNAEPRGHLAHRLQEAGLRRDQPLQRLDDDAADLVGVRLDQPHRCLDVVEGRDQHLAAHGIGDAGAVGHRLGEIREPLRREGHQRPIGHAVVAALELHDLGLAAKGAGQAHGVEIRLGAGGEEAHLLDAGHRLDDRFGKPDAGLVVGEEGGAARDLREHRLGHRRVVVADEHRAGAEQVVDVVVARDIGDMPALAVADDDVIGEIAEAAAGHHAPGGFHQCQFLGALGDARHDPLLAAKRAGYRSIAGAATARGCGVAPSSPDWPTPKMPRRKPGVSAASGLTLTEGSASGPRMR